MLAAQAGRLAGDRDHLYGDIRKMFEGFVKASVEAIESARSDHQWSPRPRRVAGELTVTLARVVDGETKAGRTRGGVVQARGPAGAGVREPSARFRQDWRSREGPREGQEELYEERLGPRSLPRFDYTWRGTDRGRRPRARKVRLLETGGSRESLEALDLGTRQAARRGDRCGAWEAVCTAERADGAFERRLPEDRGDREGDLRRPAARRGGGRLLDDEETTCLKVNRGFAETPQGVRRDPLARVAHVPLPLVDPLGQGAETAFTIIATEASSREAQRHRLYPNRLHAEEIPVQSKMMAVADIYDGAHRERPALQEGGSPRQGARHPRLQRVKDGHLDRGARPHLLKDAKIWGARRDDLSSALGSLRPSRPGRARLHVAHARQRSHAVERDPRARRAWLVHESAQGFVGDVGRPGFEACEGVARDQQIAADTGTHPERRVPRRACRSPPRRRVAAQGADPPPDSSSAGGRSSAC